MTDQIFADGVANVTMTSGVLRIDFDRVAAGRADGGEPPPREPALRLLMPLEGFVQAMATLERVIAEMERRGLVRRQPAGGTAPTAPGGTA